MKDCNSCGKCCIKYSNGDLSASPSDIELWDMMRPDIYSYVRNGKIWMNPETGKQIELCPWLRKTSDNKYSCDIYFDRPEDCRHYPVTLTQMIDDDCEMLEVKDLKDPKRAQVKLDAIMIDSRPALDR